jgi:hypothetical protein
MFFRLEECRCGLPTIHPFEERSESDSLSDSRLFHQQRERQRNRTVFADVPLTPALFVLKVFSKSTRSDAIEHVPAVVAQPVPITLSSKTWIVEVVVNTSPLVPRCKAAYLSAINKNTVGVIAVIRNSDRVILPSGRDAKLRGRTPQRRTLTGAIHTPTWCRLR